MSDDHDLLIELKTKLESVGEAITSIKEKVDCIKPHSVRIALLEAVVYGTIGLVAVTTARHVWAAVFGG